MIYYGKQEINKEDIDSVVEVLKSDFLTQGPVVPRFESAVALYCDTKHAVAVNSATSALHISLLALNVGPGDYVWTSPNTFVATANAVQYCGANVDFVDINLDTYNICVNALELKLAQASLLGKLPKVVIPVHFSGQSCDMRQIHRLSKKYGFYVIEDASHAIGGRYLDQVVGSCKYSDITVFSFHPVKIITTAEGGMALTNSNKLAKRMELFRSHGVTREFTLSSDITHDPWYYQQTELGYNYRMTELQAALGISQLSKIDEFIKRRHLLADIYNRELKFLPLKLPYQTSSVYSTYHLYVICMQANSPISKIDLYQNLKDNDIITNVHYIPVHTQPYYQNLGFFSGQFPHSEKYYQDALSLPMYPSLSKRDQLKVIATIKSTLK